MRNESVQNLLNYLDDFLVLSPAGSGMYQAALCSMLSLCDELGVMAHETIKGPTTSLAQAKGRPVTGRLSSKRSTTMEAVLHSIRYCSVTYSISTAGTKQDWNLP